MHPAWPWTSCSFVAEAGACGAATFGGPSTGSAEDFFRGDNRFSLSSTGVRADGGRDIAGYVSTGRLLEADGEVSLYELGLWSAIRIAENQMVLLGLIVRVRHLPIDDLIVSRIQFVGSGSRPALLEIDESPVIQ